MDIGKDKTLRLDAADPPPPDDTPCMVGSQCGGGLDFHGIDFVVSFHDEVDFQAVSGTPVID